MKEYRETQGKNCLVCFTKEDRDKTIENGVAVKNVLRFARGCVWDNLI